MFFILIFCAHYIAAFFNSERMVWPLMGYACIFLIRILGIVPNAWCEKNFRFDIIAKLSFIAITLRIVTVLLCAWKGLGINSIVFGDLIYHIIISLGIYLFVTFRPRLKYFNFQSFTELFQFGNKLGFSEKDLRNPYNKDGKLNNSLIDLFLGHLAQLIFNDRNKYFRKDP